MEGVTVSIDRIVIDFTEVYYDFFNRFILRLCNFYGAKNAGKEDIRKLQHERNKLANKLDTPDDISHKYDVSN